MGENGSGKSTLIEALAILMGFNPEGGNRNFRVKTAEAHANLDEFLQPTRSPRRMRNGFFLRAESHFNVASYIDAVGGAHNYGGKFLHEQSHGESFFALLQHRLTGDGLSIMDEPEAALSPTRQLSMLTRLHDRVRQGAPFIIATHSPILMADPMPITSCRVKARPI